jgi:predicted ribosome quality control (RQC) complex YloA/Tae2 family protein
MARRESPLISREGSSSLSEALDRHHLRLEAERAFDARAATASARIKQESSRLKKLRENLSRDLAEHGDAEEHRRAGDLLLANIGTAERRGSVVRLRDFYAEGAPWVELEVEENRTLQEEAARRFARYTKAKRAAREIAARLETTESEVSALESKHAELESIIAARDSEALEAMMDKRDARPAQTPRAKSSKKGVDEGMRGLRRYRSSDGYEIIVGRRAKENDQLTFRVARSYDTWMHAADYPGSHVVVRARGRDEPVPHRTIVEAAQLAAHFSQAGKDSKVAVNYTQRKFVSKPRGAAPGLVYLSSFRTLLVEPREELERV